MTEIFNRYAEKEKRRSLRNQPAKAEVMLWHRLKGKRAGDVKFRRQVSVGSYVLDFYCPALQLALEIDGGSHDGEDAHAYDAARQSYIEALGIRFLRFTNADVYDHLEGVLTSITEYVQRNTPAQPKDAQNDTPPRPSPS